MLPKVNKADMIGAMEAIKESLRSHHDAMRAPLAYIIRKTKVVQTHDDYPRYVTHNDLLLDRNKLLLEQNSSCIKKPTAEYEMDNRTVYHTLNQICKDTDLYTCIKQHKSKRDCRSAFYAIQSRWLGPNHVNSTASETEAILQTLTYDGEKKAWN